MTARLTEPAGGEKTGQLFDPAYSEPVDTTGQVTRIPGTPDAACMCGRDNCLWPWHAGCWKRDQEVDVDA